MVYESKAFLIDDIVPAYVLPYRLINVATSINILLICALLLVLASTGAAEVWLTCS